MWFDIIKKRGVHKFNVLNKLVPAFLESIEAGKEFKLSDILKWAKEQGTFDKDGNRTSGIDFRTPSVKEFPTLISLGPYVKEKPLKTLMSEVTVTGNHGLQLSQTPKVYKKNLV